jgi:Metallo-beta-lactamase superfamily
VFRIEMLPARQGDALLIEYGDAADPHRVLFDAGTTGSWEGAVRARIAALPAGKRRFELLVVSHIDTDHIGGVLPLLGDDQLGIELGDVWFNGFRHLPGALEPMGPVHGERLTKLLLDRGHTWNGAFGGEAVVVPDAGALPRKQLPGGLVLTLLSPRPKELAELRPVWAPIVKEHGLDPETVPLPPKPLPPELEPLGPLEVDELAARPFKEDTAEANGSSIAVLAEFEGRSAMLCADAFPGVILETVTRLLGDGQARMKVDAFKLPHHGSRANLHRALVERIESPVHLISTDGTQTHHPHPDAVARAVVTQQRPRLVFNYRTEFNEMWDPGGPAPVRRGTHSWDTEFPPGATPGAVVDLGG